MTPPGLPAGPPAGSPAWSAILEPGLGRLWDAVAARLQRNGLRPHGVVRLEALDRAERRALAGILGRPVTAARVSVDLADLDGRLRSVGDGRGLVTVAEALRGPLVDRPAARIAAGEQRSAVWAAARAALADHGLGEQHWTEPWLEEIRGAGTLTRLGPDRAAASVVRAVRALAALPVVEGTAGRLGRTDLAIRVTGSSHGLDDGEILASLVLRGIARMTSGAPPESAADRRALWEAAGILADEISTTVLTAGLRPPGSDPLAAGIRARGDAGCETHLTLRDLRRIGSWVAPRTEVFVCENPRVVEAALDAGSRRAMVCTAGNPRTVVHALLSQLAAGGARLHYRGDFDWPGVGIANRVIEAHGASPWRMGATDYEDAIARAATDLDSLPVLDGRPLSASWDVELMPTMARTGRVVHEEALLDLLVADLTG
ncbi:MAG: TIGR02679 family protein [Acidimicrobiales bacterium]